jgi:hypothetical protein
MRYARRVNESFVDLTYRGLSLGRRIKLTQVRPTSGYLELPSPMPVGTQVAIATDDGVSFDATVAWIYEQVAGTDRTPGMVVIPELAAESAAAWWKARVALPDDEAPRPRRPSRPVTVRPRSHTRPTPPPMEALADRAAIKADLDARVAAAAASAAPPPAPIAAPVAAAVAALDPPMPVEPPPTAGIADDRAATSDDDDEPEMTVSTEEESVPEALPMLSNTGEHAVVDDGNPTTIMQSVDTEALGLETGMSGEFTLPGVTLPGVTIPGMPARISGGDPGDDDGGPTDPGLGSGRNGRR